MATLVTGYRNPLGIFFNGSIDDFLNRSIVSQMDDFDARILQDSAHDINGRIMAIEKRGGGNDAYMVRGFVNFNLSCHFASLIPIKHRLCHQWSGVSRDQKGI
jgi:hypothetical protein